MNDKLNIPGKILPGKEYSLWADLKVNGWILASWPIIFYGDLWLFNQNDCPFMLRVIIALIPLGMILLWIRSVARWIRGMDELHRRITLEACLFAITGTFFVITAWLHLKHEGILGAILPAHSFLGKLALGFGWATFTEYDFLYFLAIILLFSFYPLGHFIFNRRFK